MTLNIIASTVKDCDFIVDRRSVLGNPYKMYKEDQRDKVCDEFEVYFENCIRDNNQEILSELRKIKALAKGKPFFKIGCHCKPKRCHADTIAYFLNNYSDSL